MHRRSFCRRTLAGVAGATALSGVSTGESSFARVTTRGHFDVNWLGQTYLKDEYGKYEYETEGSIPGYQTDDSPEEICVFVHGWLMDREDVNRRFPKQQASLERAGFDSPTILFSWDSGSPRIGWWIAAEYARQNGHKLGQFLADYRARNPETTIRVIGFSLGAMVVAPAAQSLYDRGWDGEVDSLAFLGGAVGDETLSVDGKYGPGCAAVYGEVDNFYKTDDQTLDNQFQFAEFNGALGSKGIEGRPYDNYEEHDVTYVKEHGIYWDYEDGCIQAVVDEWRDGIDGGRGAPAPGSETTSFADVSRYHWAYNQILELARRDVIAGFPDGTYRPEEKVTRAQVAAMLDQAYDLDDGRESFSDVEDHWAKGPIERAAAAGFFSGFPGGEFRPEENVTRQQLLVALQGDPDFPDESPVDPEERLGGLHDYGAIADWARDGVARMAREGKLRNDEYLVHGTDHRYFYPERDATRAQVANVCYNMLVKAVKREEAVSAAETAGADVRTFEGSLSTGESATHEYAAGAVADRVTATLSTADGADFDLYATTDGRDPTRRDFDHASRSLDGTEHVEVPAGDLARDADLAFLVDAYRGSDDYTLTVEAESI